MAMTISRVVLEGRNADSDEPWGTIEDFSADIPIVGGDEAKRFAERAAFEWYLKHPRMETRVMEEWLIGPGS